MKRTIPSVLSILIFLFAPSPYARQDTRKYEQEWEQLNTQVVKAYKEGRYRDGIALAEKAMQYALKNMGKEPRYPEFRQQPCLLVFQTGQVRRSRAVVQRGAATE